MVPLSRINNMFEDEISNGRNYLFNDEYNPFIFETVSACGKYPYHHSNHCVCKCGECVKLSELMESQLPSCEGEKANLEENRAVGVVTVDYELIRPYVDLLKSQASHFRRE